MMNQLGSTLHWRWLLAAPHRAMFFLGALQLLLVMLPWAAEMLARLTGQSLPWSWPPGWWHALLAIDGVFPFFVFGFLLTAMPRWQGYGDLPAGVFVRPWGVLVAGWTLIYASALLPVLRLPGMALVFAGWAWLLVMLAPIAFRAGNGRLHAVPAWLATVAGLAGWGAWMGFAATGDGAWARAAIDVGVWGFLLPVFFTVSHRMIPFFSSAVLDDYTAFRPPWALFMMLGAAVGHGVLMLLGEAQLTWLVDLPAAGLAVFLTVRWGLVRSFEVPLLAMLHLGFMWLGLALALFGVQSLAAWQGSTVLGLAPLHALGIGMFTVIALGMVSRVTLGHSGQALRADATTWRLCWAVQAVAVVRMLAELWTSAQAVLLVLAAVGWLVAFGFWARRYMPVYLRPRADGRPG
ncbi:NnrS family protein [Denitromonas sp.]|uniref:NnrS family protein n=1 Tax=Denitromonas sp. TaxID=2734609 RepID=UPI002AFDF69B|nr:NnrS family protein [Denitromonas sp.]